MSTIAEQLEQRIRRELAECRRALKPNDPVLQPGFKLATALRLDDGTWWVTGSSIPSDRKAVHIATCAEALDLLEEHATGFAKQEASAIAAAARVCLTTEQNDQIDAKHVAGSWPWSKGPVSGSQILADESSDGTFATIFWALRGLATLARDPNADARSVRAHPWPEGVQPAEVVTWVAEGLNRTWPGYGDTWREHCEGTDNVVMFELAPTTEPQREPISLEDHAAPRRLVSRSETGPFRALGGRPDSLVLHADHAPTSGRLVSGEQLACLYSGLPDSVRKARAAWIFVERVANGSEQQRLLEVIAPGAKTTEAAKAAKPEDRDDSNARGTLAETIRQSVAKLRAEAFSGAPPSTTETADARAGELDAAFAKLIEATGAHGKELAEGCRYQTKNRKAGERWRLWQHEEDGERFLKLLGQALWVDKIQSQLARLERNTPALTYVVHEDVTRIHSRAYKLEDRRGQRALVFDEGDPIVLTPAIAEEAVAKLVNHGAGLLGSVTAHRALRWEVSSGYERVMSGEADARTLSVDGGWTALAEMLGMTKAQHIQDLRAIVHAQAAVVITLPDGTRGNMLALRDSPAVGRRRGKVEIVLGTMLLPHYIYELEQNQGGRTLRENKRLVPIASLPPFVGRANDHGAQATASMLLMRELRTRAIELYREGAVRIALDRWAALFLEAGAPSSIIGKVLDRWTRDGDDGPAFLSKQDKDAYTLADTYERERAFLIDAGKREADGSEAGKRSVRSREAKRRREASRGK